MYTNIPTDKLINIITLTLNTDCVYTNIKQEIINFSNVILNQNYYQPKPVAARSNMWVCGRSIAGIAGSNHAVGMDVCILSVLCVAR
jgi:hypothetical protein